MQTARLLLKESSLFFLLSAANLLLAKPLSDQNNHEKPIFDFLTFRSDQTEKTLLEIFCQIPIQTLQFVKAPGGFAARYQIRLEIQNTVFAQTNRQTSYVDSVYTHSLDDIAWMNPVVIRFPLLVPPGEYQLVFYVRDLETLSDFGFTKNLRVPDYFGPELKLSDIQIAAHIAPAGDDPEKVRNTMKIIPCVSKTLRSESDTLFVYCEIYNLQYRSQERSKHFSAELTIKDQAGAAIKTLEIHCSSGGPLLWATQRQWRRLP